MSEFYKLIKQFFVTDIPEQDASSSFLEMMEKSLRKRSAVKRVGKNQIQQMMQMKPKMPKVEEEKCTGNVKDLTSDQLVKYKLSHCKGYKFLDLSNTNMKNVAVHYLKNDIPEASSYKK
jgi:competence protein ComGC